MPKHHYPKSGPNLQKLPSIVFIWTAARRLAGLDDAVVQRYTEEIRALM